MFKSLSSASAHSFTTSYHWKYRFFQLNFLASIIRIQYHSGGCTQTCMSNKMLNRDYFREDGSHRWNWLELNASHVSFTSTYRLQFRLTSRLDVIQLYLCTNTSLKSFNFQTRIFKKSWKGCRLVVYEWDEEVVSTQDSYEHTFYRLGTLINKNYSHDTYKYIVYVLQVWNVLYLCNIRFLTLGLST